jgi:hypothetical protein
MVRELDGSLSARPAVWGRAGRPGDDRRDCLNCRHYSKFATNVRFWRVLACFSHFFTRQDGRRFGVNGAVWLALARFGVVWLGLAWFGLVWLGLAWFGLVWLGLAWFGLVWRGFQGCALSMEQRDKGTEKWD